MTQWIAATARGHNSGICLLKDGELVLSIEEERLSRKKYDGGPLACMVKILEYTDRLDYFNEHSQDAMYGFRILSGNPDLEHEDYQGRNDPDRDAALLRADFGARAGQGPRR